MELEDLHAELTSSTAAALDLFMAETPQAANINGVIAAGGSLFVEVIAPRMTPDAIAGNWRVEVRLRFPDGTAQTLADIREHCGNLN